MRTIYQAHVIVKLPNGSYTIENDVEATEYATIKAAMDYIDAKIALLRAARHHGVVS